MSKYKAGVWFGDRKEFKDRQTKIMEAIKEKVAWIPVEGAIIAVREEPHGIVLIAPNPTLPGIIVLADGAGQRDTKRMQEAHIQLVQELAQSLSIPTQVLTSEDEQVEFDYEDEIGRILDELDKAEGKEEKKAKKGKQN
nr:hypothetical protein [uncultured Cupriavidus sp.]